MKTWTKKARMFLAIAMTISLIGLSPVETWGASTSSDTDIVIDAGTIYEFEADMVYDQTEARSMLDTVNKFRQGSKVAPFSDGNWYWNKGNTAKERAGKLNALKWDGGLEKAAMQRAAEVALYFEHTRPDGRNFSSVYDTVYGTNYKSRMGKVAENIAAGMGMYNNAAETFEGWLEEKEPYAYQGHRRAMLGKDYLYIGIGFATYNGCTYWAMELSSKSTGKAAAEAVQGTTRVTLDIGEKLIKKLEIGTVSDEEAEVAKGQAVALPKIPATIMLDGQWPSGELTPVYATAQNWKSRDTSVALVGTSKKWKAGEKCLTGVEIGTVILEGSWKTGTSYAASNVCEVTCNVTNEAPLYRLYNPNSGEHFYTMSQNERNVLDSVGWNYEGIGWYAPVESAKPVYRVYNPNAGDHHYTCDKSEKDFLVKVGWRDEGIGWYSADEEDGAEVYRVYNPNAKAGAHHFTLDREEYEFLGRVGWKKEGVGFYACNR